MITINGYQNGHLDTKEDVLHDENTKVEKTIYLLLLKKCLHVNFHFCHDTQLDETGKTFQLTLIV